MCKSNDYFYRTIIIFLLMCCPLCQWICDCFKNKNNEKADTTKKIRVKKSKKHKVSNNMDKSRSESSNRQIAHNQHSVSPMDSYYNKLEYESTEVSTDRKPAKRQQSLTFTELSLTKHLTNEYKVPEKDGFKTVADVLKHYNYKLDGEIGRGGYGTVYKAYKSDPKSPQTEIMACKLIDLRKTKRPKLKGELFAMEKIKHENVIKLYDHFIINNNAYIFMEYADEKSLSDEIKRGPLSNKTARRYFAQMISAVNFVHKQKISHRDLKLDNILLMKSKKNPRLKDVKISDFGMSLLPYKDSKSIIKSGRFAGTRYYMAPEIIRYDVYKDYQKDPAIKFSPFKADMWALGVCLYEMLTTWHPFSISYPEQQLRDQENGNWSYPSFIKSKIDPKADELIKLLLEPNSYKRVDSSFVMFHEWLKPEFNSND